MFDYRVEAGNPARLGVTRNGKDINFAVVVRDRKDCCLLLYKKGTEEIAAKLSFTEEMRFGDICTMQIRRLPVNEYEYNYLIDGEVTPDPYARVICGREKWGTRPEGVHALRSGMQAERFFWQGDRPLMLPYEECILYVTHVRGFTMDPSSRSRHPGTFAGIKEKIPYLKSMGINQLELMPVYEFAEYEQKRPSKKHMPVSRSAVEQINYWGYADAYYFAPKASYSASGNPVRELKELVRELHKNGIELILEFYFPVRTNPHMILDCIRCWVAEYHIDGVHVNSQGTPLGSLVFDPQLSCTKIMSESFTLEEYYEPGYEPACRRLAEYNDDFLQKSRRFLKGDEDMLGQIAWSMRRNPGQQAVVNYVACHNGFTLADVVSYDVKHNEDNGEENRDGSSYNCSCNYGEEGPTASRKLKQLRERQVRNAFLLMLLSQGVPAIYGGDEMGNSQGGNNNAWCQDNETAWIQWSRKKADRRLREFVKDAIQFRKRSGAFGRSKEYTMKDHLAKGMPDLSYHGKRAWYGEFETCSRQMGILYAGCYTGGETCYVVYNMHTADQELALPILPKGERWHVAADTGREEHAFYSPGEEPVLKEQKVVTVPPRTILILAGKKR